MVRIRASRDDDTPAIVELINHVDPPEERITLEEFSFNESLRKPEEAFSRLLATRQDRLVAVSTCGNSTLLPMNRFRLTIRVHPDQRRGGIGTALEARQRLFAQEHGGSELVASAWEGDDASRVFLERLGYGEAYRRFESELDLAAFDWTPFGAWRERLAEGGLRLITFAEAGDSEANRRRLFDLTERVSEDIPYPDGRPRFTLEDMVKYFHAPGFSAEGLFIAVDGERWVGFTGVFLPEGRPAYTFLTGVERDYRGRGVGKALKLASVAYVQDRGIAAMRTTNDTVNTAILTLNDRLGYRRLPARVTFKRSI
ncbi:MAG TPA: GNAT family N-acetyltransferase [bacterium]|jgi:GNAT superfamily N-acetyltransferase|nr:GNAT family N-acetyltransferase [bacterium]